MLSVVAPVMGQAYESTQATARLRQGLATLALYWRVLMKQRFALDVFQGVGIMYVTVRGETLSPWVSQSVSAWFAASSTGGRAELQMSRRLTLSVSCSALFLLPKPVLEVANTSYSTRQPQVLTTTGLAYMF